MGFHIPQEVLTPLPPHKTAATTKQIKTKTKTDYDGRRGRLVKSEEVLSSYITASRSPNY